MTDCHCRWSISWSLPISGFANCRSFFIHSYSYGWCPCCCERISNVILSPESAIYSPTRSGNWQKWSSSCRFEDYLDFLELILTEHCIFCQNTIYTDSIQDILTVYGLFWQFTEYSDSLRDILTDKAIFRQFWRSFLLFHGFISKISGLIRNW